MKELTKLDIMIALTVVFVMAVRIFTLIFMAKTAALTGAEIEQVMTIYESNPMAKYFLSLEQMKYAFNFIVLPGLVIATYLYFRKRTTKGKMDIDSLSYFTYLFFCVMLINFLNDCAALAGRFL